MDEGRTPEAVVAEFICAMNAWELRAWELSRIARDSPTPESYWPEVQASMDSVFAVHCTLRERPQGRQASFQRPPQYDPRRETITRVDVDGDRAHVETKRVATLGGGTYRYTLHRRQSRWLIDSLKRKDGNRWVREIL